MYSIVLPLFQISTSELIKRTMIDENKNSLVEFKPNSVAAYSTDEIYQGSASTYLFLEAPTHRLIKLNENFSLSSHVNARYIQSSGAQIQAHNPN